MRTIRKTIKLYSLQELKDVPGTGYDTAWQWISQGNSYSDWWDSIYMDAETIGLKITEFDLDRSRHADGELNESAGATADLILENHGPDTDTYKLAHQFRADAPSDDNDAQFVYNLLELYSLMLQAEYEYLSSEENALELAEANEWEFTADGKVYR